jgi:hypothetical protein
MSSHGTKFDPKWQKVFLFIEEVSQDAYKAKCNACGAIFSINHGGKNDIRQHCKTQKHKQGLQNLVQNYSIKDFL